MHFDRLEGGGGSPASATAARVILAAGSIGSTELLGCAAATSTARCRSCRPRAGQGLGLNGDFVTPSVPQGQRKVSPTHGPTISSAIDLLDGSSKHACYS